MRRPVASGRIVGARYGLDQRICSARLHVRTLNQSLNYFAYWQSSCVPASACLYAADGIANNAPTKWTATYDGNVVLVLEMRSGESGYDFEIDRLPPEDCFDGIDNNDNGAADCDDVACSQVADCFGECGSLPFTRPVTEGTRPQESWWTTTLDLSGEGCLALPSFADRAALFEIELEAGERIMGRPLRTSLGTGVQLATGCGPDARCIEPDLTDWQTLRRFFTAPDAGTYYVVFNGVREYPYSDLQYELATVVDEDCTTDVDDDRDGEAGCRDRDCIGHPSCPAFCPDEVTTLPVTLSGPWWDGDYPNWWTGMENGCGADGAGDKVLVVDLTAGERVTMRGVLPVGEEDEWVLNLVPYGQGTCDLFGPRDDCVSSGRFSRSVTVPETGRYYLIAGNMWIPGEQPYEVAIEVEP